MNNRCSKRLFSLGVAGSSRYNIERHNFPLELSLNVVNYWSGFIGLCTQEGVKRAPEVGGLGGRKKRKWGLGRQASFDFIVM